MCLAAASITANIAEGYAKISSKDKLRFYNISQGSLEEKRNFIILSKDCLLYTSEQKRVLIDEIRRLVDNSCSNDDKALILLLEKEKV